jgi:hypothetical protein
MWRVVPGTRGGAGRVRAARRCMRGLRCCRRGRCVLRRRRGGRRCVLRRRCGRRPLVLRGWRLGRCRRAWRWSCRHPRDRLGRGDPGLRHWRRSSRHLVRVGLPPALPLARRLRRGRLHAGRGCGARVLNRATQALIVLGWACDAIGRNAELRRRWTLTAPGAIRRRFGPRVRRGAANQRGLPHDVARQARREHVRVGREEVGGRHARSEMHGLPVAPCPLGRRGSPTDVSVAHAPIDPRARIPAPGYPSPPFAWRLHPTAEVKRHPSPGIVAYPSPAGVLVSPMACADIRLKVGAGGVGMGNPDHSVRRVVHPRTVRIEHVAERREGARIVVEVALLGTVERRVGPAEVVAPLLRQSTDTARGRALPGPQPERPARAMRGGARVGEAMPSRSSVQDARLVQDRRTLATHQQPTHAAGSGAEHGHRVTACGQQVKRTMLERPLPLGGAGVRVEVAPSGFEPEHPFGSRILNPLRLPIPPRGLCVYRGWAVRHSPKGELRRVGGTCNRLP